MITDDGLVLMLRATTERPMTLCLYTNEVTGTNVSAQDFDHPKNYAPIEMSAADWALDSAKKEASAKKKFAFTGRAGKCRGWLLMTRDEKAVLAYEAFREPYPINSELDSVTVIPRIRARPIG